MCPHIHNQISLSDVIFAIHPCIFTLPPAKNMSIDRNTFSRCERRDDISLLPSSLFTRPYNIWHEIPHFVSCHLFQYLSCWSWQKWPSSSSFNRFTLISTIALNRKFIPFEEPTPVTVPLFISSKILSRRTKMFKEKFVNSETLHVTIHDFQRKSFNKILRCSKISKPLAKSFEVNNYLKRLISKKWSNFTQIGKCSDVSSRHLLHSSHAHTLSDCQGQQEGVWVSLISCPFGILPQPIHISVWDDEKRPCPCFCLRWRQKGGGE